MKILEKFSVQELGTQEIKKINGGNNAEFHPCDGSKDNPFLLPEVVVTAPKPLGTVARERGYGGIAVLVSDIVEGIYRIFN